MSGDSLNPKLLAKRILRSVSEKSRMEFLKRNGILILSKFKSTFKASFLEFYEAFWERSEDYRKKIRGSTEFKEYRKLSIEQHGPSLLFISIPTAIILLSLILFTWRNLVPFSDLGAWFWISIVYIGFLVLICSCVWFTNFIQRRMTVLFWHMIDLFDVLEYEEEQNIYLSLKIALSKKAAYFYGIAFLSMASIAIVIARSIQTFGLWYGDASIILTLLVIFGMSILILISKFTIQVIAKATSSSVIRERVLSAMRIQFICETATLLFAFYLIPIFLLPIVYAHKLLFQSLEAYISTEWLSSSLIQDPFELYIFVVKRGSLLFLVLLSFAILVIYFIPNLYLKKMEIRRLLLYLLSPFTWIVCFHIVNWVLPRMFFMEQELSASVFFSTLFTFLLTWGIEKELSEKVEMKECPFCGEAIFIDSNFCRHCGRDVLQEHERKLRSPNRHLERIPHQPEDSWEGRKRLK